MGKCEFSGWLEQIGFFLSKMPEQLKVLSEKVWTVWGDLLVTHFVRISNSRTVFENRGKSLIQHWERSELRLHFLVDKN